MRLPILTILLIASTSFGINIAASAQSAGSHPVCAIYYGIDADGTPSCNFDTRQQCMETISGIGGFCIDNQYYHSIAVLPPRRAHAAKVHKATRAHSHATSSH
jgi:hypothetical protein